MTWKANYLANLFELIEADGVENRELLALFEIERRLHAKVTEFIDAFHRFESGVGDNDLEFNPLVDRRHLTDIYSLAHLDATVSALEQASIDRFVRESGLSEHQVAQIRQQGKAKAEQLIRDAIANSELDDQNKSQTTAR